MTDAPGSSASDVLRHATGSPPANSRGDCLRTTISTARADRRPVPIVNPIRWRMIENRAMLLLDVRFVQIDLRDGHRPASVASCA
jgi:hypothetical protein